MCQEVTWVPSVGRFTGRAARCRPLPRPACCSRSYARRRWNWIVDLEAVDPDVAELLAHTQVLRMGCIGLQGAAAAEFRQQDHVAGIVDLADIQADLDVSQAVDPTFEGLEQGLDLEACRRAFGSRLGAQPPHHDMPDRPRHSCFLTCACSYGGSCPARSGNKGQRL